MVFQKHQIRKALVCVALSLLCIFMPSCLRAESHREETSTTTENPSIQTGAPVVDTRPRVALTYDDGPSSITTRPIVDELNKYGYHATFFVVGNRTDHSYGQDYGGDAMVYAYENGNEIGIHGYTHQANYASCSNETYEYEIYQTLQAIQNLIPGYQVRVMRPVGGSISNARIAESEFAVINWSVDTLDWTLRSPAGDAESIEEIVNNALKNIEDGDIILMHDIYNNTYEATVILLARLNEMGFNVVTVSELLGEDLEPGRLHTQK